MCPVFDWPNGFSERPTVVRSGQSIRAFQKIGRQDRLRGRSVFFITSMTRPSSNRSVWVVD